VVPLTPLIAKSYVTYSLVGFANLCEPGAALDRSTSPELDKGGLRSLRCTGRSRASQSMLPVALFGAQWIFPGESDHRALDRELYTP
jgi:hypothetical protein